MRADTYGAFDKESIEEERRLCYVAMTRARKHLYLSHSQTRRVFGVSHVRRPSRFLAEIPIEHIKFESHFSAPKKPWGFQNPDDEFSQDNPKAQWGDGWGDSDAEFSKSSSKQRVQQKPQNIVRFSPSKLVEPSFDSRGDIFAPPSEQDLGYTIGNRVKHPDYGQGVIMKREGQNEGLKVTVQFPRFGVKKFVVRFAPLELVR